MYPASLPNVPGLGQLLSGQGDFPVAEDFASRILTLPTHRRVTDVDIDKMGQILRSCVH
jgi:dTDP-4-amino-4,6-dideoxygalactose transaminase